MREPIHDPNPDAMIFGPEEVRRINGVELCVQTCGVATDPVVLLIAGSGSSMLGWSDRFCERLAAGGRFVIRYDHRDMGRSVSYPPGAPGYFFDDLTADALGVLDSFDRPDAHLVGMSMGAGIAQQLATRHPERVLSLTAIASSPTGSGGADLPPMSDELRAFFSTAPPPDPADRVAQIDYVVAVLRHLAAPSRLFDEGAARADIERDFARTTDVASALGNHDLLRSDPAAADVRDGGLASIVAPTLVVHGAEDPLFPVEHGHALAKEIPGAELLVLAGVGHELPRTAEAVVADAILRHTSTR
jgi:pimeloyl-ACP methyl ester carboxylesterase